MKLFILLILFVSVSGCNQNNQGSPANISGQQPQTDFEVVKLFTQDNCSVYRFSDGGYPRYYVNCSGVIFGNTRYSCGKGQVCPRPDSIQTVED